MLEKFFHLKENNTTVKTEVLAGITTFMTMAYILAVNPAMLSASGMNATAVLIATCLASFVGTLAMALMANYPFALAPGMGLNAYFAYTVCLGMGYDWRVALMAVFVEGLIFIVLSLTNVREAIFNAIPSNLKKGVSAGIGLFIAFIGLQGAHIVVNNDSTLLTYVDFAGNWHTEGICAFLALIGLVIIVVLHVKGLKGSILVGIIATWILGMICQAAGIYHVDVDNGFNSLYPTLSFTDFSSFGETFGQCFQADFSNVSIFNFIAIVLAFLFVDMFDTIGTLVGTASRAGMLNDEGNMPKMKEALLSDAIGTIAGAATGTSTITTFVESATGVAAGGRTGLTALTTGILFLASIFIAPIAAIIPAPAISAVLIYVGILMIAGLKKIDFDDVYQLIPVALMLIAIPISGSIGHGIGIGMISYTVLKVFSGKGKEVSVVTYIISIIFLIKFFAVV